MHKPLSVTPAATALILGFGPSGSGDFCGTRKRTVGQRDFADQLAISVNSSTDTKHRPAA